MILKHKDLAYINSLKQYLFTIIIIFSFSLILGLISAFQYPDRSTALIEMFKQTFGWITELAPYERMIAIFKNNVFNSFLALVLGAGFGIAPVFIVAVNGFFLGMIMLVSSKETGVLFVLAAILPHGIIELPMVLLSAGIGLRLGHVVFLYFKGVEVYLIEEFKQGIWFFIRFIVPLLFIAAFIESYVTTKIILFFRT